MCVYTHAGILDLTLRIGIHKNMQRAKGLIYYISMYICIYTHRYTQTYLYVCISVHAPMCTPTYTYVYIYMHINTYIYISILYYRADVLLETRKGVQVLTPTDIERRHDLGVLGLSTGSRSPKDNDC